jgi:hypothetical protein
MLRSLVPVVLLCCGCATHADKLTAIRSSYHNGNLPATHAQIDAGIAKSAREADVLKLDKATALFADGRVREAEQLMREVRDNFEAKEGRDLKEGVAAMLTDDQRLAYAGEDYEKVLVRFYLALANLMQDGSDATAYALQVNEKQQQIVQSAKPTPDGKNLKENYKLVTAGAYLYGALREETHTNYDDAARAFEQVAKWQPEFAQAKADLERVKTGAHSKPGHGVVYVFAMVGRGPYKEERAELVSTVAVLIADRILSALGKQNLPPNVAPIKVPRVVKSVNTVNQVQVFVGGKPVGATQTLTDVGRMAQEQCDATLPETIARAVVRRAVKKGIVYGTKEAIGTDKTQWSSIALDVVGVAWEATESADTRCWGLLPDKIQVLRLELPEGVHSLALKPEGANVTAGAPDAVTVSVENGRNTYVVAHYPGARMVGKPVTNKPAK